MKEKLQYHQKRLTRNAQNSTMFPRNGNTWSVSMVSRDCRPMVKIVAMLFGSDTSPSQYCYYKVSRRVFISSFHNTRGYLHSPSFLCYQSFQTKPHSLFMNAVSCNHLNLMDPLHEIFELYICTVFIGSPKKNMIPPYFCLLIFHLYQLCSYIRVVEV